MAGTTGESPTLSHDEQIDLIAAVTEAADVPVLAGAGSNDTAAAVELTERATAAGADGILSVAPYYNRPPQAGLYDHFRAVAAATHLPMIIYDIPVRTGRKVDTATLLSLAGVEVESLGLEGESLAPYLTGAEPEPRTRDCFVQYNLARNFAAWHGVENWRAMVRRPWKYVLHENGETELYHLGDDPGELANLAGRPAGSATAATLREALLAWSRRTGDPFVKQLEARAGG